MKKKVEVVFTRVVEVEVDESKFDEAFMKEFRESFFKFFSIDDHIEHLACITADTGYSLDTHGFVEGYGVLADMGISGKLLENHTEVEILEE